MPRKARTGEQFWPFLARPAIGQNSVFDQSRKSKTLFGPIAMLEQRPATDLNVLQLLAVAEFTNKLPRVNY